MPFQGESPAVRSARQRVKALEMSNATGDAVCHTTRLQELMHAKDDLANLLAQEAGTSPGGDSEPLPSWTEVGTSSEPPSINRQLLQEACSQSILFYGPGEMVCNVKSGHLRHGRGLREALKASGYPGDPIDAIDSLRAWGMTVGEFCDTLEANAIAGDL